MALQSLLITSTNQAASVSTLSTRSPFPRPQRPPSRALPSQPHARDEREVDGSKRSVDSPPLLAMARSDDEYGTFSDTRPHPRPHPRSTFAPCIPIAACVCSTSRRAVLRLASHFRRRFVARHYEHARRCSSGRDCYRRLPGDGLDEPFWRVGRFFGDSERRQADL